jgi:predicted membrane protein
MYIAREEIATNPIRLACAYGMHSIPMLGSIYNFRTIDAVLKASHAKALIPVIAVYFYTNYRATLLAGQTLYWFLTWEDWTTAVVSIFLTALFLGAFQLSARATTMLRPRKSSTLKLIDGIFYRVRPRRGSK